MHDVRYNLMEGQAIIATELAWAASPFHYIITTITGYGENIIIFAIFIAP